MHEVRQTTKRDLGHLGAALLAALSVQVVTSIAHADPTREECIAANEKAQSLQQNRKLNEAHAALVLCVSDACPTVVRDDCVQRLKGVEDATPTVAFGAKDGSGRDLVEVQVAMDGAPFAGRLDGAALAVDPGAHEFVFQTPGGEPLTKTFVIREGEKDRHEVVVLGPAPAVSTTEPAVGAGGPPGVEGQSRWSGQKTLALVVGGAGVVGLGVGGAFGLAASSPMVSGQAGMWRRMHREHGSAVGAEQGARQRDRFDHRLCGGRRRTRGGRGPVVYGAGALRPARARREHASGGRGGRRRVLMRVELTAGILATAMGGGALVSCSALLDITELPAGNVDGSEPDAPAAADATDGADAAPASSRGDTGSAPAGERRDEQRRRRRRRIEGLGLRRADDERPLELRRVRARLPRRAVRRESMPARGRREQRDRDNRRRGGRRHGRLLDRDGRTGHALHHRVRRR